MDIKKGYRMKTVTLTQEQVNALLFAIDQEIDRGQEHRNYLRTEKGQKEEDRDRQYAETDTLLKNLHDAREILN